MQWGNTENSFFRHKHIAEKGKFAENHNDKNVFIFKLFYIFAT